jgi:predicted AAA+ superfamily ATPase
MNTYQTRVVDQELDTLLSVLPAVLIEGPKGVGKTATAQQRAVSSVYLDDAAQRAIAEADPKVLLQRDRPILIDEWQRVPPVWDAVRRAVDANHEPNQYLLTGSATPTSSPLHSGAGRIVTLRMRPLSFAERGLGPTTVSLQELLTGSKPVLEGTTAVALADYTREIVASGFPGFRHLQGRALRSQLDSYLARIVDRDFEEQGHRMRQPETLKRWMRAYAAVVSTTAPLETIRDAATGGQNEKPSKNSTLLYREILEQLWIADPVPAWLPSESYLTELVHAPKQQLADPALATRLLGIDAQALLNGTEAGPTVSQDPLRDGTQLGRLFESLVTLSLRVYAQAAEANVRHLRTKGGRQEIDLIVVRGDQRVLAVEVKLSTTVHDDDVRHLAWLRNRIGDELLDAIVVTTGPQAYRRRDGIGVVPLALLGP